MRCSSSPQCWAMTTRRFSASPSTRWLKIGTANAYSVLHRLLLEADTPRESALRELLSLRG
jgi:hypothetical protein